MEYNLILHSPFSEKRLPKKKCRSTKIRKVSHLYLIIKDHFPSRTYRCKEKIMLTTFRHLMQSCTHRSVHSESFCFFFNRFVTFQIALCKPVTSLVYDIFLCKLLFDIQISWTNFSPLLSYFRIWFINIESIII